MIFFVLTLISLFDDVRAMDDRDKLTQSTACFDRIIDDEDCQQYYAPPAPSIHESLPMPKPKGLATRKLLFLDMFRSICSFMDDTLSQEERDYHRFRYIQLAAHPDAEIVIDQLHIHRNSSYYSNQDPYLGSSSDELRDEDQAGQVSAKKLSTSDS